MYNPCGHLFTGKEFLFYYFSSTLSLRMNGFLISSVHMPWENVFGIETPWNRRLKCQQS